MTEQKSGRVKSMFRLLKYLRPYHRNMIFGIICGIGQHLSNIAISCIGAYMVGLAVQGMLLDQLSGLLIALSITIGLRVILSYGEGYLNHEVAFHILADFRIKLFDIVEKVSPTILLNMRSGQLASTLMSDVEVLEWFFAHTFGSVMVAFVVPIVTLVFMGCLCWYLPLIMIVLLAIMVIIPFIMKKKADAQGKVVREALADANAVAVEGLQGMKEILSLNYREAYREKNDSYMKKVYKAQWKYGKRLGLEGGLLQTCVGFAMMAVMALAVFTILQGNLGREWYAVVILLAGLTFNPVMEICNMARNFGLILASSNRVFSVLESDPPVKDTGKDVDISELNPEIKFEAVSFRYRDDLSDALNNVSFTVKPGQRVAIVGHSGAGKTSCINLILRYWDVNSGSVKIGDMDVRDMSLKSLHTMISAVTQEVYLFHSSIKENIRLGRMDATDEEVEQAAKAALAHDFIISFPDGYDTIVGERGSSLSGGQRQRIAIARAFLRNSPILLLDEAVSNLDSENENEIQKALSTIYSTKTTLMVAHRLSTIMSADYLLVMKDGRLVQQGTHDELIRQKGYYRELIAGQYEKDS